MAPFISIVIPNYNGVATIAPCLRAALASRYDPFEIVVVDDGSTDDSVPVIERFPCRLVRFDKRLGAAAARNAGARHARGDILFFTDADCLIEPDALAVAARTIAAAGPDAIVGGTYTPIPHDADFYSLFQSIFIHYSETKKADNPDYVAAHAMVVDAEAFRDSGGFSEDFLPIIEDVNYSHRMRRAGFRLIMDSEIQVQHVFNFSLYRSLRNAVRKSMYWTMYSVANGDLFEDSGTASVEMKVNVAVFAMCVFLLVAFAFTENQLALLAMAVAILANIVVSRKLIAAFYRISGGGFAAVATLYYMAVYPLAVGAGIIAGMVYFMARGPVFGDVR